MNKDKAKEILKRHNAWRRSEEIGAQMPDTAKEVGEAIDVFVFMEDNIPNNKDSITIDDLERVKGNYKDIVANIVGIIIGIIMIYIYRLTI